VFVALTALYYFWTLSFKSSLPKDATTLVVGRDFLQFWMYGRAAWAPNPGRFYDHNYTMMPSPHCWDHIPDRTGPMPRASCYSPHHSGDCHILPRSGRGSCSGLRPLLVLDYGYLVADAHLSPLYSHPPPYFA
jgi:hypothetical protein